MSVSVVERRLMPIAQVPPSMNTNVGRGHWSQFRKAKKEWEASIGVVLMVAGIPRPIPADGPVLAEARLTFPSRRRDAENFRPLLSKALGDILVAGRWLADDTDEDWRLMLICERTPGPAQTAITLRWTP